MMDIRRMIHGYFCQTPDTTASEKDRLCDHVLRMREDSDIISEMVPTKPLNDVQLHEVVRQQVKKTTS